MMHGFAAASTWASASTSPERESITPESLPRFSVARPPHDTSAEHSTSVLPNAAMTTTNRRHETVATCKCRPSACFVNHAPIGLESSASGTP